jgi:hypothetical protein
MPPEISRNNRYLFSLSGVQSGIYPAGNSAHGRFCPPARRPADANGARRGDANEVIKQFESSVIRSGNISQRVDASEPEIFGGLPTRAVPLAVRRDPLPLCAALSGNLHANVWRYQSPRSPPNPGDADFIGAQRVLTGPMRRSGCSRGRQCPVPPEMFPDGLLRIVKIASLPQFCLTESGAGWMAHRDVRLQLFVLFTRPSPQPLPASALQAVRIRSSRPKVPFM